VTFLSLFGWVPSARLSVIATADPGGRHILISRQEVLALARRRLLAEPSSSTLSLLFERVPHLVTAMHGVDLTRVRCVNPESSSDIMLVPACSSRMQERTRVISNETSSRW
jgi:hypothetical protein